MLDFQIGTEISRAWAKERAEQKNIKYNLKLHRKYNLSNPKWVILFETFVAFSEYMNFNMQPKNYIGGQACPHVTKVQLSQAVGWIEDCGT